MEHIEDSNSEDKRYLYLIAEKYTNSNLANCCGSYTWCFNVLQKFELNRYGDVHMATVLVIY